MSTPICRRRSHSGWFCARAVCASAHSRSSRSGVGPRAGLPAARRRTPRRRPRRVTARSHVRTPARSGVTVAAAEPRVLEDPVGEAGVVERLDLERARSRRRPQRISRARPRRRLRRRARRGSGRCAAGRRSPRRRRIVLVPVADQQQHEPVAMRSATARSSVQSVRQPRWPSETATTVAAAGRAPGRSRRRAATSVASRPASRSRRASSSLRRRTSATRSSAACSCSSSSRSRWRGRGVVGVLVAVPAPVPELGSPGCWARRPRASGYCSGWKMTIDRGSPTPRRSCAGAAAPGAPRGRRRRRRAAARRRRRARAAGRRRRRRGARSRSSAWSRRMKCSSARGSSRTPIGGRSAERRSRGTSRRPDPADPQPARRVPCPGRMQGLLKRLATSGLPPTRPRACSPAFLALVTLPLYTRPPDRARATARRDAADGDHPRRASCCASAIGEAFVRFCFDDEDPRAPAPPRAHRDGVRCWSARRSPRWSRASSPGRCRGCCSAPATRP